MRAILIMLTLLFSSSLNAWEVRDHYKDEDKFILLLMDGKVSDLGTVLNGESRELSGINLGRVIQLNSDGLQLELKTYLNKRYPTELKNAFSSAGNMHSPKVRPLRKPFEEALVNSTYVKSIGKVLREYNYEIIGVSTEKFMLIERKHFDAMSWLTVKQLTSDCGKNQA